MKKIIIAAFLMLAASGVLSAQTTKPGNGTPGTNKNNPGYVDANKNNTCDNYENNTRALAGKGQGQKNGRGQVMVKVTGNAVQQCRVAKPEMGKEEPKSLVN